MVKFIDNIICCSMADVPIAEKTSQETPSASLDKTKEKFVLKLYKNSNAIASRTQVHSSLHNKTSFKYRAAMTGKCQFDFPRLFVEETKMTELGSIDIFWNNL